MKTLYPLCGLLFSGKTTLARKIVERRRLLRSPPAYPSAALTPFTLGWAQNASGAPAWTAGGVLARLGELDLSRRRIWIDRPRGLPGFPLFGPAVAQQLAAGFEQVPAVQPQRQLRLPQIRAGDGARLRAGLPALRIRTGRVATSSEGKDSGSGVRYSFRQQCRNGRPLRF